MRCCSVGSNLRLMLRALLVVPALVVVAHSPAAPAGLRVGMMPAVNSIPLIVAEAEGYFASEGVAVELEMFHNQLYRETALQTGRIDGSVSDLINAINAAAGGFALRVTSVSDGLFALVSAPGSRIRSLEDWKAAAPRPVQVGLLQDSIIFYSAERMLQALGADPAIIEPVSTLQVPTRMEMVVAGQIEAALLPEPMSRVALARGAHLIADSSVMQQTAGVLLFTPQALTAKAEQIAAFYRAYNRAVASINADPDRYRQLVVDAAGFPQLVRNSMVIPPFQRARVPSRAEFDDVAGWMRHKGLLQAAVSYRELVTDSFLPR